MKLLNSFVSPFAARVRLAIYAYDLPVEIVPSGQWLANFRKSPDYLALNPVGRVPTLILDDGSALPESSVIVEFLADAFRDTGLRPARAQDAAMARLLAQLAELYVQAPLGPLFGLIFSGQRDAARARGCFDAVNDGLGYLDHFIAWNPAARNSGMTVADCALVPFLSFAELFAGTFEMPPPIERHPALFACWQDLRTHPASLKVIGEIRAAVAASPLKALVAGPDI